MRVDYIVAGNAYEQNVPVGWSTVQIMPNAGDVIFRSNWGLDAIYLHINVKNGNTLYATLNHDQADVTSFILGYKGRILALDAGYPGFPCRYDVNKPENHNLILVDSYGPKPPCGPSFILEGDDLNFTAWFCSSPSLVDGYIQNSFVDNDFSFVEVSTSYGQKYYRDVGNETKLIRYEILK